jgi:hypothetical protein
VHGIKFSLIYGESEQKLQNPEDNYTFPSVCITFSLFGTEDGNEGCGFKIKQILKTSPQSDATQYT